MKKGLIIIGFLGLVFLTALILVNLSGEADAVPPTFSRIASTAAATTSISYMTAGTGTTTLIYDSTLFNGTGDTAGGMVFNLGVQYVGSSTQAILAWRYEYSNGIGCITVPTQCDWYDAGFTNASSTNSGFATGFNTVNSIYTENRWTFASSTIGGRLAPQATSTRIFQVPILARYVKTVFYVPIGATSGAVWAEALGIRPRN